MTEEKTIYGYTTYYNAVHYLQPNLILCNNITDIDNTVYDNMRFNFFGDDEDENPVEIYQWFLTSLNEGDVEWLEEKFNLLFTYSEKLDVYVLCVSNYGTLWNGVAQEVIDKEFFEEYIKGTDMEYKDID